MIDLPGAARSVLLAIAASLSTASAPALPPVPLHDLVIRDVRVVDVEKGTVGGLVSIAIARGRIVRIGRSVGRGRREVPGNGAYALPGLWDMHVHALWTEGIWAAAAQQFLAHCVTGVRDMGGTLEELTRARRYLGPAPRLVAAGMVLDGSKPVHPEISIGLDGPEAARAAVERIRGAGGDFVKVYTLLPPDAFAAVVAAAARERIDVAGHAPAEVDILDAARDMRSIEHMRAETGLYCDPAQPKSCTPLFTAFRTSPSWQTPTLVARAVRAHMAPASADSVMASAEALPPEARQFWSVYLASWRRESAGDTARRRRDFKRERSLAALLFSNSVPVLAGTDAGLPLVSYGASLHDELQFFVDLGVSPAAALRTATIEPARYLRRARQGRLRKGGDADLCLLDGNPLKVIGRAASPRLTVVAGQVAFDRTRRSH